MTKNIYINNGDGTSSITISQGKCCQVDTSDVPMLKKYQWHAMRCSGRWYASTTKHNKGTFMHRMLIKNAKVIDHIDGNGLNNCRSNIRPCTSLNNAHNRGISKNNTSGYKGVCYHKGKGMYCVSISFKSYRAHIGYFKEIEDAAQAYNFAAWKYHGKFARYN